MYGASVGTLGVANLMSVVVWLYAVWRERRYLWPGYSNVGYGVAVRCMARAYVPSAWLIYCRLS